MVGPDRVRQGKSTAESKHLELARKLSGDDTPEVELRPGS